MEITAYDALEDEDEDDVAPADNEEVVSLDLMGIRGAAPMMALCRGPDTPGAQALVADVAERLGDHLEKPGGRPLGPKAQDRLKTEWGMVLAGLLSRGRDKPSIRIQRGRWAPIWQGRVAPQPGFKRFWRLAGALGKAGLLQTRPGIRYPLLFGGFDGEATRLAATEALRSLAERHGCTDASRQDDWPILYTPPPPPEVPYDRVVTFRSWPEVNSHGAVGRSKRREIEASQPFEALRTSVAALNAACDQLTVTGCARPRFSRIYGPNLFLGGRFYATGDGAGFQILRKQDRAHIRVNGSPLVEVDLKAAALSIFLAHMKAPLPDGDPYDVGGIEREAVKTFCVQSLYAGRLKKRWAANSKLPGVLSCAAVREAVLTRYPALEGLSSSAPSEAVQHIPDKLLLPWASGQYLIALEAQIMARALGDILAEGGFAWPLHDALLVPPDGAERAKAHITQAFQERLDATPRVEIKEA